MSGSEPGHELVDGRLGKHISGSIFDIIEIFYFIYL